MPWIVRVPCWRSRAPKAERRRARRVHARPGQSRSATGLDVRLPDNSVLSPDASLVALERWQSLSAEQRRGFAPLCPDLVVELASTSGASASDEGARLGWLLIPQERAVEVWGPLQGCDGMRLAGGGHQTRRAASYWGNAFSAATNSAVPWRTIVETLGHRSN